MDIILTRFQGSFYNTEFHNEMQAGVPLHTKQNPTDPVPLF